MMFLDTYTVSTKSMLVHILKYAHNLAYLKPFLIALIYVYIGKYLMIITLYPN